MLGRTMVLLPARRSVEREMQAAPIATVRVDKMPDAFFGYEPLFTPKLFAPGVWIVDGPEIGLRVGGLRLPFPTRMTIVRLPSGDLWVHSPVALAEALIAAVAALGPVGHLVAPSTLHFAHLSAWQTAFPGARSYGPAALAGKGVRLDEPLGDFAPAPWGDAFVLCRATSAAMTEIVFFHRASRTLILTDLIENFEPRRIRKTWLRWLVRASGAADPDGKAPLDMQMSFLGRRRDLRAAVRRMIAWAPERIVLAHGRCYDRDAVRELERAFRWVL